MKTCTKCGQGKPESEFYHVTTSRDGLSWNCKRCYCDASLAWAKAHPERRYENDKKRREAHPEKKRASMKRWREAHPERARSAKAAVKAADRARKRGVETHFTREQWQELKSQYGHTCLGCGHQEPEIKLTPDHVIALCGGGGNGIENIQPLCLSCNCSKGTMTVDYRPCFWAGVRWTTQSEGGAPP
jgi:5-methylcytosine-specific restriction endonuclease McrA